MPQSPSCNSSSLAIESSISPRDSTVALLPSVSRDTAKKEELKAGNKRKFFGLGRKKDSNTIRDTTIQPSNMSSSVPPTSQPALQPAAALSSRKDLKPQPIPVTPRNHLHQAMAASPSRLRSSSPRLHSPASSEIFERNVQEPVPMSTDQISTAHIPAHMMTEDHIPPALEASAQAITSNSLGPDEVEIVTSSSHQPAAASVLEHSASNADLSQFNSPILRQEKSEDSEAGSLLQASAFIPPPGVLDDETASNYGQLDPTDVRRLSFISFADVVQSEHQFPTSAPHFGEDGIHMGSISSIGDRAASPYRSPRSPGSSRSGGGLATPPPVTIDNAVNLEQSPARSGHLGSPGQSLHGELNIETMRQAVRKTASGDLSHIRSPSALSPVSSPDDSLLRDTSRQPTRKTDTTTSPPATNTTATNTTSSTAFTPPFL